MSMLKDLNSVKQIQNITSLDGELERTVVAVSLTENFKVRRFASEYKFNELVKAGTLKVRKSAICSCQGFPGPCGMCFFSAAVGRACASCLSMLGYEMLTHPKKYVFRENLEPRVTINLTELDVENANAGGISVRDAFAAESREMILAVALLEDRTLRVFNSDQALSVLGRAIPSVSSAFIVCNCQGFPMPCSWCSVADTFSVAVASWLSERSHRLLDDV